MKCKLTSFYCEWDCTKNEPHLFIMRACPGTWRLPLWYFCYKEVVHKKEGPVLLVPQVPQKKHRGSFCQRVTNNTRCLCSVSKYAGSCLVYCHKHLPLLFYSQLFFYWLCFLWIVLVSQYCTRPPQERIFDIWNTCGYLTNSEIRLTVRSQFHHLGCFFHHGIKMIGQPRSNGAKHGRNKLWHRDWHLLSLCGGTSDNIRTSCPHIVEADAILHPP